MKVVLEIFGAFLVLALLLGLGMSFAAWWWWARGLPF